MSIQEEMRKFKSFIRDGDLYLAVLIIAVAFASFALGRLSVEGSDLPRSEVMLTERSPRADRAAQNGVASIVEAEAVPGERAYVASKNGTKYHLPWCPGASQMKEENKVWFDTKEEAEAAGYTPAANCKGL